MAARITTDEGRRRRTPAFTIVAALAIAMAAPASAAATHVTFKKWIVTTSDGKKHKVKPGHKFKHCRDVLRIKAKGHYNQATKGNTYNDVWSLNDTTILSSSHTWASDHGPIGIALFRNSGSPLPDGTYKLQITEGSTTVGHSKVKLATPSSC